jgi:predicted RND superfamily exporter protein
VTRNSLLVDACIAGLIATVALIVSPGLAVAAILALVVLLVCAISLVRDVRKRRMRS